MNIYFYIKTHNKTGLQYFGKTVADPFRYLGSGTYWKRHLKKYGNNVTTHVYGSYASEIDAKRDAIEFSKIYDIAESPQWANSIPETLDGWAPGQKRSEETKRRMRLAWKNRTGHPHTTEAKHKIGAAVRGRIVTAEARLKMRLAKLGKKRVS